METRNTNEQKVTTTAKIEEMKPLFEDMNNHIISNQEFEKAIEHQNQQNEKSAE
jgi:hypothetical protein